VVLRLLLCRRGYDVVAFAAAGAALSVGLDICPDAIAAANKQRDEQLAGHPDAAKVTVAGVESMCSLVAAAAVKMMSCCMRYGGCARLGGAFTVCVPGCVWRCSVSRAGHLL